MKVINWLSRAVHNQLKVESSSIIGQFVGLLTEVKSGQFNLFLHTGLIISSTLSMTSSASTIHNKKSRFRQQPTNVKLKSFNYSRFFSFCVS